MFGEDERCIVSKFNLGKFLTLVNIDSFGYREWLDSDNTISWLELYAIGVKHFAFGGLRCQMYFPLFERHWDFVLVFVVVDFGGHEMIVFVNRF